MLGLNTLLGKHFIALKGDDMFCLIDPLRNFSTSWENYDLAHLKRVRFSLTAEGCFKPYSSTFGKLEKVTDWLTQWHKLRGSLWCIFPLKLILG